MRDAPRWVVIVTEKAFGRSGEAAAEYLQRFQTALAQRVVVRRALAVARGGRGGSDGPPNSAEKNEKPPPEPPKVPGGIRTGADEEPFARSTARSATRRSEPLRTASSRWSRPYTSSRIWSLPASS